MQPLHPALARTLECLALLAIGFNLRKAGLFDLADAQTAQKIAAYVTLPAAVLHACGSVRGIGWEALVGGPLLLLANALTAGIVWVYAAKRHKRERALLCGCSAGGAAAALALPLAEAVLGPAGVVATVSVIFCNALAVYGGSYLMFGSAGPAFPEAYTHEDGGVYRGEWRGMAKEGLGVYRYASGARYEGEWRGNVKDGRGVYYYPSGGTYEGEWSGGVMDGVGVRTYSSGKVVAGRWRANKLEGPLELWQAAPAAEGAADAALAARAARVGGGRVSDAARLLAARPELWAAAAGLAVAAAGCGLPAGVGGVAAALAPANGPLMLLSAGMLLGFAQPQTRQVRMCVRAWMRCVANRGCVRASTRVMP
ncbi:MAG: hypothetical protein J3K34DRAFT_209779 [Monoraphidium minutum]|nr:MAG: hypothetical protein J3K34DRAFT_209779 [Monoraphidium minutum]